MFRCVKYILFSFFLLSGGKGYSQNYSSGNQYSLASIVSVSGKIGVGANKPGMMETITNWEPKLGRSNFYGAGISILRRNKIAAEIDFVMETHRLYYDYKAAAFEANYRAFVIDFRFKINFNSVYDHTDFIKFGFGYGLMPSGSGANNDLIFNYTYGVVGAPLTLSMEYGYQLRIVNKSFIDLFMVYRYGLRKEFGSNMYYHPGGSEPNVAGNGKSNGSYFGVGTKIYYNLYGWMSRDKKTHKAPIKRF